MKFEFIQMASLFWSMLKLLKLNEERFTCEMGWTGEGSMTCCLLLFLGKSRLNCRKIRVPFQCKLKIIQCTHLLCNFYPEFLYFILACHPSTGSCSPRSRKPRRSLWRRSPWSRRRSWCSLSSSGPPSGRRNSSGRRSIGRWRCLLSAAGCRGW